MAKQFAEKLASSTSGAEAPTEEKGFIAALEALRHPKASFSANCKAEIDFSGLTVRLDPALFQNMIRTAVFPQILKAAPFQNVTRFRVFQESGAGR